MNNYDKGEVQFADDEIERLRAINAELLEGLCEIKSQMHNLPRSATADYVERTASDLIAKAKGE